MGTVLRRLRIENLVLIREAELELDGGLNAITGETGAGKTILSGAIGLLLGAKGDTGAIGAAAAEAYVEAEFDLPEEEALGELAELRPEGEETLVLARRIFADGRTRAYAWGRSAAREDVAAAAEALLAMSGQFEQRRLGRPSYQLATLDSFAGADDTVREARRAWRELQAARRAYEELTRDAVAPLERLAPELAAAGESLRAAELSLREAASDLRAFLDGLEAEPGRLEQVEGELERLADLRRRYRLETYEELLGRAAAARSELDAIAGGHDPAATAGDALAAAQAEVDRLHAALRMVRTKAAPAFADAVAQELAGLGVGEGEFRAELAACDSGPAGADQVTFLVRPNAGLPFAPVAETASGGELSRIALAIAAVAGGETMVFDEIDAGIGGGTAHAVADTLRRLAERAQVITITHLPQIASVADRHFRVEKVAGDPTHTRIEALDADDRRDELERMLGGADFLAILASRENG